MGTRSGALLSLNSYTPKLVPIIYYRNKTPVQILFLKSDMFNEKMTLKLACLGLRNCRLHCD